jgi:hypothetical protein
VNQVLAHDASLYGLEPHEFLSKALQLDQPTDEDRFNGVVASILSKSVVHLPAKSWYLGSVNDSPQPARTL